MRLSPADDAHQSMPGLTSQRLVAVRPPHHCVQRSRWPATGSWSPRCASAAMTRSGATIVAGAAAATDLPPDFPAGAHYRARPIVQRAAVLSLELGLRQCLRAGGALDSGGAGAG